MKPHPTESAIAARTPPRLRVLFSRRTIAAAEEANMAGPENPFATRLARLKADLIDQGRRVQALLEASVEAAFARDGAMAARVVEQDELIDRVDVDIEKAAVALLSDATDGSGGRLDPDQLRMILTIVKVNNELERIADVGVSIAEAVPGLPDVELPPTFRMMANSVIAILRDANHALDRSDSALAQRVLAQEDAVERFKKTLVRDCQERVARSEMNVDTACVLTEIAACCEAMSGHCSNVAEQTLYVTTGKIVRHMDGGWTEIQLPGR